MVGEIALEKMSVTDVTMLLKELDLAEYEAEIVRRKISGKRLSYCRTFEDVAQLGISANADARLVFDVISKIKELRGKKHLNIHYIPIISAFLRDKCIWFLLKQYI